MGTRHRVDTRRKGRRMKFIFEDKEIDLEVEFSIIYEFDISCQDKVGRYKPKPDSKFKLTECSDGEPSDWCAELFGGKCKHRKYIGILTEEQMEVFIDYCCIYASDVETMGSLGSPGCGPGLAPAVSFSSQDDPDVIDSAYITPLCDPEGVDESNAEEFRQAIRQAIIKKWK